MHTLTTLEPLYQGEIRSFAPFPASRALGAWGRQIVATEFGESPETLPSSEFREALQRARATVAGEKGWQLARSILGELGLPLGMMRLDVLRLRAITPGLELVPEAAPAFYAHRDTWYGNPRAQINGWLPLLDANPANSFRFFLDDFERSVANDSENFDTAHFQMRGGFGRTTSDPISVYPRALQQSDSQIWDVELEKDGLLLFSAAHLHQTLPNRTPRARFSLDFRFLRQDDRESGRGAPDPDNRCRGCYGDSYSPCS